MPFKPIVDQHIMDDADLAGPLVFACALGFALLLVLLAVTLALFILHSFLRPGLGQYSDVVFSLSSHHLR